MRILSFIHIAINTIFAIWMAYMCLLNPILGLIVRRFRPLNIGLAHIYILVLLMMLHIGVVLSLGIIISPMLAAISAGLLFLHWAYSTYYLSQRFASVMRRSRFVRDNPLHIQILVSLALISNVIIIIQYIGWYWIFALIPIWLLYGYCCSEIAIRSLMLEMQCDRKMAISAINSDMGRNFLLSPDKYPFP